MGDWTPEQIAIFRKKIRIANSYPHECPSMMDPALAREGLGVHMTDALDEIERLQEWRSRSLESFRAIGLALGLPDPLDPNISDADGLKRWSGPFSEKIDRLLARVAKLEDRLEIRHAYQCVDGKTQRVEMADPLPADGIACRDETIRIQDEQLAKCRSERERREELLRECLPFIETDTSLEARILDELREE